MGFALDTGAPTKNQNNTASIASFTFTNGFAIAVGDLLLLAIDTAIGQSISNVTDNVINGTGWTKIGQVSQGSGASFNEVSLWMAVAPAAIASGAMTVTVSYPTTGTSHTCFQLFGYNAGGMSIVLVNSNTGSGNSTACNAVVVNNIGGNLAFLAGGNKQNSGGSVTGDITTASNQTNTNADAESTVGYSLSDANVGSRTLQVNLGAGTPWEAVGAFFMALSGIPQPAGVKVANKFVGPPVLRSLFKPPYVPNTEVITTADPTVYLPPIRIPNPFVGPMVMRRNMKLPKYWNEVITSGNVFLNLTASDTIGAISDTADRLIVLARTASDSLAALTDQVLQNVALPRTVSDAIGALSDSADRLIALPRTASDTLGAISDSAVRAAMVFSRTASDALGALSDVASRLIALPRTAADTLAAITESTTLQKGVSRTASDALSAISDTATRSAMNFTRTASDTISALSDSAVRAAQAFLRTAADSLNAISDSTVLQKGISRTASDTISAISDTASRLIFHPRTASDALNAISDTASRGAQAFIRTASDALGSISDIATQISGGAITVFISFVSYGRSGILKVTGRTGSIASQGRSGILKAIGRTGIAQFFGRIGK